MKRLSKIFQALLGVVAMIVASVVAMGRWAWRVIRQWWQKSAKWIRWVAVAVAGCVVVGILSLIAWVNYQNEHGRYYWDELISDNCILHSFADNTYRVYHKLEKEYTTPKFRWLSDVAEGDSLAVYALPGKRGFINVESGEIVIDAERNNYSRAWFFSDGLAAVERGGKVGFINANNELVIPFKFDYSEETLMWDFGYVFHGNYCLMTNSEGKFGIINRDGEWLVEPAYDMIFEPDESGYWEVVVDDKYGVLDAEGKEVYPTEYDSLVVLDDGFELAKEGKMWHVNFEGEIVHPFVFDSSCWLEYPISLDEDDCNNVMSDYAEYWVAGGVGIMNIRTGKPITPAIYSAINMLSKDIFEAQMPDSYSWTLLDSQGREIGK